MDSEQPTQSTSEYYQAPLLSDQDSDLTALLKANEDMENAENVSSNPYMPSFSPECDGEVEGTTFELNTIDAFQTIVDFFTMFVLFGIWGWKKYQTKLHITTHRVVCLKREYYNPMFFTTSYYIGMLKDVKFINIQADTRPCALTYSIKNNCARGTAVFFIALPGFFFWVGTAVSGFTFGVFPILGFISMLVAGSIVIAVVVKQQHLIDARNYCCNPHVLPICIYIWCLFIAIVGTVLNYIPIAMFGSNGACAICGISYILFVVSLPKYPVTFPSTLQVHFSDLSAQSVANSNNSDDSGVGSLRIKLLMFLFTVVPNFVLGYAMYILIYLTTPVSVDDKFVFKNKNQVINAYLVHKDAEKAKTLLFQLRKDHKAADVLAV